MVVDEAKEAQKKEKALKIQKINDLFKERVAMLN